MILFTKKSNKFVFKNALDSILNQQSKNVLETINEASSQLVQDEKICRSPSYSIQFDENNKIKLVDSKISKMSQEKILPKECRF